MYGVKWDVLVAVTFSAKLFKMCSVVLNVAAMLASAHGAAHSVLSTCCPHQSIWNRTQHPKSSVDCWPHMVKHSNSIFHSFEQKNFTFFCLILERDKTKNGWIYFHVTWPLLIVKFPYSHRCCVIGMR